MALSPGGEFTGCPLCRLAALVRLRAWDERKGMVTEHASMSGRVVEVLFGFDPGLVRQPPLLLTTFPAQRTAWCGCISSRGGLVTTSTMQLHLPLSPTLVLPRGLALTDNAAATGRIQGFFE